VVVFAAGNTANHAGGKAGVIAFPANVNIPGVLTVGASDRNDKQANYSPSSNLNSSENQIIDIVAPSSSTISGSDFDVWTIDIPGSGGYNSVVYGSLPSSGTNYEAYTGHFGGTSASTPQVAGVAALMLSINPELTQIQVANIIRSTARKANTSTYTYTTQTNSKILPGKTYNARMGYGVLDAFAAVNSAIPTICYSGNYISMQIPPTGASQITWMLPSSGAFSFSPTSPVSTTTTQGNLVKVYRIGNSNANGTLYASVGGNTFTRVLTPCTAPTIDDYGASNIVYYTGSNLALSHSTGVEVFWTVSDANIIYASPAQSMGNLTLISRIGSGTGNVTVSLRTGSTTGPVIATKSYTPCPVSTISGPNSVCTTASSFSLTTPLPGVTVFWTLSGAGAGNFSLGSTQGTSTTVTRQGIGMDNATLEARTYGPNGTTAVFATKTISPCSPEIIGPNQVCFTNSNFSLPSSANWSVTGPFTFVGSNTGSQVTLVRTSASGYSGTLTAKDGSGNVVATKSITPCQPLITPPSYIECQSSGNVFTISQVPAGATFSWYSNNSSVLALTSASGNTASFRAYYVNDWTEVMVECGVYLNGTYYGTAYIYVWIWPCYSPSFSFYPNPASNIVNIEIDTEKYENARNIRGINMDPAFDIRLYDRQGNLVRNTTTKSNKTQLNITGLPSGIYYLHVYDGISKTPEIKQIIVQ